MIYKHTQTGYLMIAALIIPLFILYFVMNNAEFAQILPIVFFILLIALSLFYSLTVEINETMISVKFGIGIINKKFILKDIESCNIVKNYWYYGWGIRFTPHGWLYNISGLSAVEIQMKNNKKYRIGTDEPKKLEQAITQAIKL